MFADRNRGAPIKHDEGPAFKWIDNLFMHKSITQEEKEQFHRDHEEPKKRSKREPRAEPRPEPVNPSRQRWSESEVAGLFPFGLHVRMPIGQIQKMAESQLLMPSKDFGLFRFNLLTAGLIHMHKDGMYYRE